MEGDSILQPHVPRELAHDELSAEPGGRRTPRFPLRSVREYRSRTRVMLVAKRIILFLMMIVQVLTYKVLTEARYLGQRLDPVYFKFTTLSDILSLLLLGVAAALLARAFFHPRWMGLTRTCVAAVLACLLLWLGYGVKRFEASEFSPVASSALIVTLCFFLATLATRSFIDRSKLYRALRVVRNSLIVFFAMAIASFAYQFTYPSYTDNLEIRQFDPDAGVVLGAAVWSGRGLGERPSPTFRKRIDVGYDLLAQNVIPRLVVTGANAPGEQSEAAVAKREYVKLGIDEARIVAESASRSTLDQVLYIREELKRRQGWERFVIISDQYHLARVIEMCRFNGIEAIGSPSRLDQPLKDLAYYRLRESVALLAYWLLGK